ncbi:Transmembrane protein, partial [Parasponia andersonii]
LSPFHVAAKNGYVEILEKLKTECPEIWELLTCNGQTALHIAVNSGKKNVVRHFLVRLDYSDGLLNKQDKDGNTPLHLATILQDYEILLLLLNDTRVQVNATNKDGLTPMDIISSCNKLEEYQKLEIVSKLTSLGASPDQEDDKKSNGQQPLMKFLKFVLKPYSNINHGFLLKTATDIDMVLATLIATVTFATAYQVPGGFQTSSDPKPGEPLLRKQLFFKSFIISDAVAFGLSSSTIFLQFLATVSTKRDKCVIFMKTAKVTLFYSIWAMVVAFASAIYLVLKSSNAIATVAACVCFVAPICFNWMIRYSFYIHPFLVTVVGTVVVFIVFPLLKYVLAHPRLVI